ncbi:MAG: hypothetical protein LUD79_04095 [Oscillospiraceae bacterium]|nr:hypothetical protein [Oscillospiraceae bacterium]
MKRVQKILHSHPVIHRYLSDDLLKVFVSLVSSLTFNVLYAVWEMICGIYYQSYWFVTLGCYYILLTLARLLLLREARGRKAARQAEWKRYRACGILLLFLNLILTGIVVLAVRNHQGSHYAGYLIYAMAAYTTCKIVIAIRSLVKYRNFHEPILAGSKVISFVSAMVSMLSLEIAMILHFGEDWSFFQTMTVLTGTGVCLVISVMAVYMVVVAQRALHTIHIGK